MYHTNIPAASLRTRFWGRNQLRSPQSEAQTRKHREKERAAASGVICAEGLLFLSPSFLLCNRLLPWVSNIWIEAPSILQCVVSAIKQFVLTDDLCGAFWSLLLSFSKIKPDEEDFV